MTTDLKIPGGSVDDSDDSEIWAFVSAPQKRARGDSGDAKRNVRKCEGDAKRDVRRSDLVGEIESMLESPLLGPKRGFESERLIRSPPLEDEDASRPPRPPLPVAVIPAPVRRPRFDWNHSRPDLSDDQLPAVFRSMEWWESVITASAIDVADFRIGRMVGVEPIASAFLEKVAKPCLFPEVYACTINSAMALNFAIVGKRGNGRRTAAKLAGSMINTSGVVIAPHNYARGNLSLAFDCAALWRPFVAYVDDFDVLCRDEAFVEEYVRVCRGPFVSGGCCRVWMILAMSPTADQACRDLALLSCAKRNFVELPQIDPERLVKMLFDDLADRRISVVRGSLTEARWMQLRSAIAGASARDVNEFAVSIATKALQLVPITVLAARSAERSMSARAMLESAPPQRTPPESGVGGPSTPIAPTPPTRGDSSLATSGVVVPRPDASASVRCVDFECASRSEGTITIDWADVESMYTVEEATQATGWVQQVSIPKSGPSQF
jgi:hypothetical protein